MRLYVSFVLLLAPIAVSASAGEYQTKDSKGLIQQDCDSYYASRCMLSYGREHPALSCPESFFMHQREEVASFTI